MQVSLPRAATGVAGVVVALLMVPLVAMQFTAEVNWSAGDFVVAGPLLFAAGMTYVVAARRVRGTGQRLALASLVLALLAIVWAELAVGLFT